MRAIRASRHPLLHYRLADDGRTKPGLSDRLRDSQKKCKTFQSFIVLAKKGSQNRAELSARVTADDRLMRIWPRSVRHNSAT